MHGQGVCEHGRTNILNTCTQLHQCKLLLMHVVSTCWHLVEMMTSTPTDRPLRQLPQNIASNIKIKGRSRKQQHGWRCMCVPTAADLCVQGVFIVGVAWGHHHHPVAACCQCNRQGAQDVAQATCLAPGGNLAAIGGSTRDSDKGTEAAQAGSETVTMARGSAACNTQMLRKARCM